MVGFAPMKATPEKERATGYRILAAVPFFGLALWLGGTAARVLWQRSGGPFFGSFGFNFNFGLLTFGEPWSSWFVLLCLRHLCLGGLFLSAKAWKLSPRCVGRGYRPLGCCWVVVWLSSDSELEIQPSGYSQPIALRFLRFLLFSPNCPLFCHSDFGFPSDFVIPSFVIRHPSSRLAVGFFVPFVFFL
jgi:hypothetical protein